MLIVTGGGTGIGQAVALAGQAAGKRVLVTGRRPEPLAALSDLSEQTGRSGGRIEHLVCDNADVDDVGRLADRVTEPVHGLVLAAGGNPATGRPDPASLRQVAELYQATLDSNLRSTVLTLAALSGQLADDASVVCFSSIGAEYSSGFYGPAKAAVAAYAAGQAAELGPRGIRVNCIAPGYITDTEFFADRMTPERAEQLRQQTALGRVGDPDDVVALVDFLLSPASRHITGQNLHLNGGAFTTR